MCGVVDECSAGDFEPDPVLVRGVMGRMIVGVDDLVEGKRVASVLDFVVNGSTGGEGFTGDDPVGVLIVR